MVEYLWRASHRKPLQFGQCPCIFYGRLPALFPIAYMRYRRGRPKAFLARQVPTIGRGKTVSRTNRRGGRPTTRWGLPKASLLVWVCRGVAASESEEKAVARGSWKLIIIPEWAVIESLWRASHGKPLRIRPLAVFLRPATGRLRTALILWRG